MAGGNGDMAGRLFRMSPTGNNNEPYFLLPESMPTCRVMELCGLWSASADVAGRILRLVHWDTDSVKAGEFPQKGGYAAGELLRITFAAGASSSDSTITLADNLIEVVNLGDLLLRPGDRLQVFGAHANDTVSDVRLTLLVSPMM